MLKPGTCSTIPFFVYEGSKKRVIEQVEKRWPGAILVDERTIEHEQLRRFRLLRERR